MNAGAIPLHDSVLPSAGPSISTTLDLNAVLANLAVSADIEAARYATEAADIERQIQAIDSNPRAAELSTSRKRLVRDLAEVSAAAQTWRTKATEARAGKLYVSLTDQSDGRWVAQNHALYRSCIHAGRVVYETPSDRI